MPEGSERPPLRERKKAATRARILDVAERLFEARGYDQVTVAEIADGADISVKTLFMYFRSKEDLAFADTSLLEATISAVDGAPRGGEVRAVAGVLAAAIDESGSATGIEAYHRRLGDSEALHSRLLRMWAQYEDAVTDALAARHAHDPATPADRLSAIQIVGLIRSFTSPEVRHLATGTAALHRWLDEAVASMTRDVATTESPRDVDSAR